MDYITLHANAKVNLYLDVLRKRDDGYHEIETLFQSIHVSDELKIFKSGNGIQIKCEPPWLPTDGRNLVYGAAKLIMDKSQLDSGVRIELRKSIPIAAGLGGGSADAAATLFGINQIFEIGYSLDKLMELGKFLGADIPFCLVGGMAKGEGVGDRLTPILGVPKLWLIIVNPGFAVSTAWAYKNLNLGLTKPSKSVNILIRNLRQNDLICAGSQMYNALEKTVMASYPQIGCLKEDMLKHGAIAAMMSGSGATVFGLAENELHARQIRGKLDLNSSSFCEVVSTSEFAIHQY